MLRRSFLASALAAAAMISIAADAEAKRKPDLADAVAGTYFGDVISDARGSSQSGVTVTIARTGPNTISVQADYARIPPRTFKLERVMDTIQNVGGTEVFLLDLTKTPRRLDLTIDDASWSGDQTAVASFAP